MDISSLTIAEIKKMAEKTEQFAEDFITSLEKDRRVGVREIYRRLARAREAGDTERRRLEAMFRFEDELRERGFATVAGVDEAGRGPLAGPVVAAAVILPDRADLFGLNDSKQINAVKRVELAGKIKEAARDWAIGLSSVEEILELNIHGAGLLAMKRAVLGLKRNPSFVLVDGFAIRGLALPQLPITGGDAKSASIAAASILAKVERDGLMDAYHAQYPQYGFDRHRGYGTVDHLRSLARFGPCPIHRTGYGPVKDLLERKTILE